MNRKKLLVFLLSMLMLACVDTKSAENLDPENNSKDDLTEIKFGEGGFEFTDIENLRPGIGVYSSTEVIPVRVEVFAVDSAESPYVFSYETPTDSKVSIKVWFASKKGTTVGRNIVLSNGEGYTGGFKVSEVENLCGTGSQIQGLTDIKKWDDNIHFFLKEDDAKLYDISYTTFSLESAHFVNPLNKEFNINLYISGADQDFPYNVLPCSFQLNVGEPPLPPLVGEKFIPTADETARPGVGAFSEFDIIPIRGEYIESKSNLTTIEFKSGEEIGGSTNATRKAFRMWFVIKKGTEFNGPMTYVNLVNNEGYRLGTLVDEVENILGAGSTLGAGNSKVAGNIKNIQGHFSDNSDNALYEIYYTIWDVGANAVSKVYAPTGKYSVPFYIEPRTESGNTGDDIPKNKLYRICPVSITVVNDGSSGGGNTFKPEDYAGCDTQTFSYTENNLNMRIDIPKNRSEKTPFLIYVTGGSWTGGSVGAFENQSKYLATRGIAGVRVVYSYVSKGGTFQIGADEMRAAYDFAVSKAVELNLDVKRFGYVGGSAGCTIAAYAAMVNPECDLFIGCNGLYDLLNLDEGKFPARNSESMKYLAPYSQEQLASFSPIRIIPKTNIPAISLFHGTNDNTILHQRSVDFVDAVTAAGGRAEMNSYVGSGHGFFNAGDFEDVTLKMYKFARSVFGLQFEAVKSQK